MEMNDVGINHELAEEPENRDCGDICSHRYRLITCRGLVREQPMGEGRAVRSRKRRRMAAEGKASGLGCARAADRNVNGDDGRSNADIEPRRGGSRNGAGDVTRSIRHARRNRYSGKERR